MKRSLFKALFIFVMINCFFSQKTVAQDEDNKWVFGLGLNAVDYFPALDENTGNPDGFFNEITNAEDHWNIFAPSLSISRYWKNRFAFSGVGSLNKIVRIGDRKLNSAYAYVSADAHIQYFLVNPENYFTPYLFSGVGYTFTSEKNGSGATLNVGIGGDYWFSSSYGVRAQGSYKYNSPDFTLQSHVFYSFSLIIKPNAQRRFRWSSRKKFNWRN